MSRRLPANVLPLAAFVRKSHVISMYRRMMRASRGANDPQARHELRRETRTQFRAHMHEQDAGRIAELMQHAAEQLKTLEKMVDIAGGATTVMPPRTFDDRPQVGETKTWEAGSRGMSDRDTLGRAGTGWPWSRR